MSTGIGTWGDKHDENHVGPARRSFDQEYDKSSAFEYKNRSFAQPQPWRTYPVLGGDTGDELDLNPLTKEQRDKLLPNKSLNPEYNRYFDEIKEKSDGQSQIRDDHIAMFSPQVRKVSRMKANNTPLVNSTDLTAILSIVFRLFITRSFSL
jgi:hypothetical protein